MKHVKIGIFVGVLILFGLIHRVIPDKGYSFLSGGSLRKAPTVESVDTLLSGKYMKERESYVQDHFTLRDTFIEDYYVLNRLLGRQLFRDRYITPINGQHVILRATYESPNFLQRNIHNISLLHQFLEAQNIHYSYYVVPTKSMYYETYLPSYVEDYSFSSLDFLLNRFQEEGISFYNLFEIFPPTVNEKTPLYFDRDHHWTTEQSFAVYQYMLDQFIEQGILDERDRTTIDDFSTTTYNDIFAGASGRALAYGYRYNQRANNYTVITPKALGSYSWFLAGHNEIREGDFHALLNLSLVEQPEKYLDTYMTYPHISRDIVNNNVDNGKTLMLVGDSFIFPIASFFTQNFQRVVIFDPRKQDPKDLPQKILEEQPDMVIGMSYIHGLQRIQSMYNYFVE